MDALGGQKKASELLVQVGSCEPSDVGAKNQTRVLCHTSASGVCFCLHDLLRNHVGQSGLKLLLVCVSALATEGILLREWPLCS